MGGIGRLQISDYYQGMMRTIFDEDFRNSLRNLASQVGPLYQDKDLRDKR